jgi:NhaP-type Na+/H+ or K+/H+ antiporter
MGLSVLGHTDVVYYAPTGTIGIILVIFFIGLIVGLAIGFLVGWLVGKRRRQPPPAQPQSFGPPAT